MFVGKICCAVSERARKCYQKLFGIIMKQGKTASNLPQCTARGQYALKQCNDSGKNYYLTIGQIMWVNTISVT